MGRDRELQELKRLLALTHTVTLTGPGGIGKSRLALRAAHTLARHFRDGVWWIELAEVDRPGLVVQQLAHALNVSERRDGGIDEAVARHLRTRRALIVLDDCDGRIDDCRELAAAIVSRSEGVRILCTSRQRLGVSGEAVVAVAPLEVPASPAGLPTATLAAIEGPRLLVDRAQAVFPDFRLTEQNRVAVVDICRRLDGLPLAIELAAARLASLSPSDLLARLDDRFRLLSSEARGHSRRHRALLATVEWSHELLGEDERILWRRLSVFAGSFDIAAAEAVCSGGALARDRLIDALGSLVDRSILSRERVDGEGRYRLLETMRLFGAERLREADEEPELKRRHADWYYALVTRDDLPWWSVWEADLVDLLDAELANLEAALSFYAASPSGAAKGLRMATDLWPYRLVRGSYRRGRRQIESFLAVTSERGTARAMAFFAAGFLAQAYGDLQAARVDFDEADRLSAETGGDRQRAYALLGLGLLPFRRGELDGAREAFVASYELMLRVTDDTVGRSFCLYFLATALAMQEEFPEARRLVREALDGLDGSDSVAGASLHALSGIIDWRFGDLDSADRSLQQAVRVADRLRYRWGLATSLDGLAWTRASAGNIEQAALLLGAVASVWQELGIDPVPYWKRQHDGCTADVRASLGDARFDAAWERGVALSPEQVVALALEDVEPTAEQRQSADEAPFELTARELEVAHLVADGLSNPAIAASLFVSRATVKTHVSHILRKLDLDSRVQLASWVAAHDPTAATSHPR